MIRVRAALAAAFAALSTTSACDSPRAPACEGQRVATFRFQGQPVAGDGGCPFSADAASFTATVALASGGSGLLCIDRPEAVPLRGTFDGGHLEVSSPRAAANVASCACDVLVEESVVGDLLQGDDGGAAGFTGELRDEVTSADGGASCEPDAGGSGPAQRCGVPCELRWQLNGS